MWRERWGQVREYAGGALVLLFCAAVLSAAAVTAWREGRWPFSDRGRAAAAEVHRPGLSRTAADSRPSGGENPCVVAVHRGAGLPPARDVSLPAGHPLVVLAACPPGVQVVDVVVVLPPPQGVLAVVGTVPVETAAGRAWAWAGSVPDLEPGTPVALYVFADGQPAGRAGVRVAAADHAGSG